MHHIPHADDCILGPKPPFGSLLCCRRRTTSWVRITWKRVQRATTSVRPMWPRSVWHIAMRPCSTSSTSSRRAWRPNKHFPCLFFTATLKQANLKETDLLTHWCSLLWRRKGFDDCLHCISSAQLVQVTCTLQYVPMGETPCIRMKGNKCEAISIFLYLLPH